MTFILNIPPDLEVRLAGEAHRLGISPTDYAVQALERQVPPKNRRAKLVALLQSWIDDLSSDEQKWVIFWFGHSMRIGPSERKLFPPELEGVTW